MGPDRTDTRADGHADAVSNTHNMWASSWPKDADEAQQIGGQK